MAQQAFKHIVKKVVSASSAVLASNSASSADDSKDDMDEIAHLVFGAALPSHGTPTPAGSVAGAAPTKYDSGNNQGIHPLVPASCSTTPPTPAGQPLQVHSDPNMNAAIISLGRRMASNSAIQRGVMETISQSGWLMYGSGGMFIPLEEGDSSPTPGAGAAAGVEHAHVHAHAHGEMSDDDDQPGIPLSDDESLIDWEEDFGDGTGPTTVVREEEALARSFPHMSIVGTAPRPLPNSNSVPLLSSLASASIDHQQPSPHFSPTITPTPTPVSSRTGSIAEANDAHHEAKHEVHPQAQAQAQAHGPTSDTTSTRTRSRSRSRSRTPSPADRRRARAAARRKAAGIIPSFVSWIRSFFVDVPTPSSSTSTSAPATSTSVATEDNHGAVEPLVSSPAMPHESEGMPQAAPVSTATATSTPTSTATSASSSNSTSTSAPKPEGWWFDRPNFIAAAVGVATVILVLFVTKRVNPSVFHRVVAYLTR